MNRQIPSTAASLAGCERRQTAFAWKARPLSWSRSGTGANSMKAESLERSKEPFVARRVRIKGKRKVVLDEADYEALLRRADVWEPELPAADADGNYPALEALD